MRSFGSSILSLIREAERSVMDGGDGVPKLVKLKQSLSELLCQVQESGVRTGIRREENSKETKGRSICHPVLVSKHRLAATLMLTKLTLSLSLSSPGS